MVKPTRSLTTGFVETSSVDTASMDVTVTVDVPEDVALSPIAQASAEELPATPKLGEEAVSRKLDAEAKEGTEIKAKKPPTKASKQKSAQVAIAPSVEEKSYVDRTQFQEFQQRIIALQGHELQLQAELEVNAAKNKIRPVESKS